MKKIVIIATVVASGMALSLHAEEEGKGKGKGKVDPAKRVAFMLEKLDTDGSGTISKEEFAAGPIAEKMKGKEGALDKIFAARDSDGDGELSKKELAKPMGKGKGPGPDGKGKAKKKGGEDAE